MNRLIVPLTVLSLVIAAFAAPDFSLTGFAEGVTGGKGGRTVEVSSASAFKSSCRSSEKLIIRITGKISNASTDIASNKTIIGEGESAEITKTTLTIDDGRNIIIRNIRLHHSAKGNDVITIIGGKNIWIDHCDIHNEIGDLNGDGKVDTKGDIEGGDVDWYDGLIDMTESSANITISWNNIHDSFKAMLVGKSDSDDSDRKVTFHHNHFYNLWERVPSYRGGTGHIFNNYYSDIDHSAVNSRKKAKLRIEGNVFENVGSGEEDAKTDFAWGPIGAYYSKTTGCWDVEDNIFTDCKGNQPTTSTCSFTPPYTYAGHLQPSSEVRETVLARAGVGKLDGSGLAAPRQRIHRVPAEVASTGASSVYTIRGTRLSNAALRRERASGVFIVSDPAGVRLAPLGIKAGRTTR